MRNSYCISSLLEDWIILNIILDGIQMKIISEAILNKPNYLLGLYTCCDKLCLCNIAASIYLLPFHSIV